MQLKQKVSLTFVSIVVFAMLTSIILPIVLMDRVSQQVQLNFYNDFFDYIESEVEMARNEIEDAQLLSEIEGLESLSVSIENEVKQKVLAILSKFHFGESGHFFALDENRTVLNIPTQEGGKVEEFLPFSWPEDDALNKPLEVEFKQQAWLLSFYTIEDWNWTIVAQARKDEFLENKNSILFKSILVLLVLALAVNLILVRVFSNVGVRMRRTVLFLRQIREGDYSGQLSVLAEDEIGELEGGINSMVENVRERTEELRATQNELEFLNSRLAVLATSDGLTGIANRRRFDEQVSMLWTSHRREQKSICLIFIDVDHFKLFNDNYGHVEGDDCLRMVAESLAGTTALKRPGDLVARYGGEEFVILMSDPSISYVKRVVAGILTAIRDKAIPHTFRPDGINHVTVSIGVNIETELMTHNVDTIIRRADEALYRAKRSGRDNAMFFSDKDDLL